MGKEKKLVLAAVAQTAFGPSFYQTLMVLCSYTTSTKKPCQVSMISFS